MGPGTTAKRRKRRTSALRRRSCRGPESRLSRHERFWGAVAQVLGSCVGLRFGGNMDAAAPGTCIFTGRQAPSHLDPASFERGAAEATPQETVPKSAPPGPMTPKSPSWASLGMLKNHPGPPSPPRLSDLSAQLAGVEAVHPNFFTANTEQGPLRMLSWELREDCDWTRFQIHRAPMDPHAE